MWPDWVSNLGPLALETGVRVNILTDQIGGGGYGGGRGGWAEVDRLRVVVIRLRDARFSP